MPISSVIRQMKIKLKRAVGRKRGKLTGFKEAQSWYFELLRNLSNHDGDAEDNVD